MSYSSTLAKVAVADESGQVTFYTRELKEDGKFNAGGSVSAVSWSPDGKYLVCHPFDDKGES